MITPGEVRLVWFPFSASEAEPYKKRPVLVLGVQGNPPDQAILVMMITANQSRFRRPGTGDIPLASWHAFGLLKPSVLRTRRLWTAEARDFSGELLGCVDPQLLEAARAEVRKLLT